MEDTCGCGQVHKLSTKMVEVCPDAHSKLVDFVNKSSFCKVLLFFDKEAPLQNTKQGFLKQVAICPVGSQSVFEAENICSEGEDLVVAYGSDKAISVAKFFAYANEKPLAILPQQNFLDFTFSKFARLYDGVEFGFYEAAEPQYIFVSAGDTQALPLQSYFLSSKFIALFDSIVAEQAFGISHCQKMKKFFKKTLNSYVCASPKTPQEKNVLNIWTLIRLGQAMSFFGQTKFFFGGDRGVVERLCMLKKGADYLEMEALALKLVINAYSCFYSSPATPGGINLNKHIDALAKLFNIAPSMVIKKLASSSLFLREGAEAAIKSKHPYLAAVYDKTLSKIFALQSGIDGRMNPLKKYQLLPRQVELCFALSADFYHSPCTLHLLAALGFLDKLL